MGEKLSTLELRQQAIIKELEIEVATLTRKFQEALLDDLTGLMKRKEITEAIRHSLNKGHLPTSLLFLDLNGFKEINDTKGHLIGDLFLIQFAEFLKDYKESLGAEGRLVTLSRLGGDEFVIHLSHTNSESAAKLAGDIKQLLTNTYFNIADCMYNVFSAIGVSTTGHECSTFEQLLHAADLEMYEDKAIMRKAGEITRQVSVDV